MRTSSVIAAFLVALGLAAAGSRATAGDFPTVSQTPEHKVALDAREAVHQWRGSWLSSAIDSSASPDALFAASLDLEARVGEVDGVESIVVYDRTPAGIGATWTMAVPLYRAVFSIRYEIDRASRTCTFRLDPDKPSDIASSLGRFRVEALPGGGSRLHLSSTADSGGWAPTWLVHKMTEKNAEETLVGVRRRAEAGG